MKRTNSSLLEGHEETVGLIATELGKAQTVLIGTHEHPDGDALGSSLALYHALRAKGKDVVIYVPDPAPDFFSFLPGVNQFTNEKPVNTASFDVIVLLDSTSTARAHLEQEIADHPNSIVIDHHFSNPKQGTINLIVPEAAATAHILYRLFDELRYPTTKDVATSLLTGIFTDTGSFMHDSVSPGILEIASDLMQKGARLSHIAHETYQKKDLPGLQIWGKALSRIMINKKTGTAISLITLEDMKECHATLDDLDGVVNMINTLPDAKFALLLVEHEPGKVKGSLRSEPHKNIDVSVFARRLGGGGHILASGFEIPGHIVRREGKWRIVPVDQK